MVKNDLSTRKEMKASPLIIAHRGASSFAPENTLAAIKMAVDSGADGVEFDVQLASDSVPVVIHDTTLNRTALRVGNVSNFTSIQLAEIDVGSWFNAKYPKRSNLDFAKETIPTLAQVLDLLQAFRGLIYIELKTDATSFSDLVKAVCDTVRDSNLLPQIILKSFDLDAIPAIKHLLLDVQTAALFGPTVRDIIWRRRNFVAVANELGADQISLHYSLVNRILTSLVADDQTPVTVWTVDKPEWLTKCQKLGIGALITNDPGKLLKWRERAD